MDDSLIKQIIQRVETAEQLAPAGTQKHADYVKTALYIEWPRIKAMLLLSLQNRQHSQTVGPK